METIQQLSNESFSYSWLIDIKPSFDALNDSLRFSLDTQDGSSFIEMDPNLISMPWSTSDVASDFDFGLPSSQSQVLVHADQIFSDGLLLPLHLITPPKSEVVSSSSESTTFSRSLSLDSSKSLLSRSNRHQSKYLDHATVPSGALSSTSSSLLRSTQSTRMSLSPCSPKNVPSRSNKPTLPFFKSCAKSPKKVICKYLCFFIPLCKKVKGMRIIPRSRVRSCADSQETSPRVSNARSSIDWHRGNAMFEMGSEKLIHDAVLYCKKSNVSPM